MFDQKTCLQEKEDLKKQLTRQLELAEASQAEQQGVRATLQMLGTRLQQAQTQHSSLQSTMEEQKAAVQASFLPVCHGTGLKASSKLLLLETMFVPALCL